MPYLCLAMRQPPLNSFTAEGSSLAAAHMEFRDVDQQNKMKTWRELPFPNSAIPHFSIAWQFGILGILGMGT